MRLLMTTDAVGGVWQYAEELARALRPHGVETILAVLGPAGDDLASDAARIIATGLPLDWLAADSVEVIAAAKAVAHLARQHDADLVQLNSPALAAGAEFDLPVVAVAHGCPGTWWQAARGTSPPAEYAWHGELMAEGLRRADVAVAPSAAFAAMLQRTYHLPSAPLVVHNGRRPPAPSADDPADLVFTAGRLWDEVKNVALLDAAAPQLSVPFRAAGPVRAPHGATVHLGHLDLLGTLDPAALAAEFARRPVYVSAASFEPFGLAVLEAAAAGCPLILSDTDTFRELWSGAALFVREDTAEAYVAAIERVRGDAALRAHLGEAAEQRAQRYRPEPMAAAMVALYREVHASARQVAA